MKDGPVDDEAPPRQMTGAGALAAVDQFVARAGQMIARRTLKAS